MFHVGAMWRKIAIPLSIFALAQAWAPAPPRPLARNRSTSWARGPVIVEHTPMRLNHRNSKYAPSLRDEKRQTATTRLVASTSPPVEELYDMNTVYPEKEVTLTRILNALLLSACFGYALYTILNIDHGMTRGWTAAEIAKRVPLDNWNSYESALNEKPIMTKTGINVIIYLLGDWLSQTAFQKKNVLDFDVSRTLRNGFIGLCFGPLVHQYYEFSDQILPVEGGLMNRAEKILMDQTIYLTVKCSMYIGAVSLLGGDSWATTQQAVKDRIGPVVVTAWKFWPLVHCITYGLVPARHRILWVNCVDLVWNAILASKAREPEEPSDDGSTEEDDELPKAVEPLEILECEETREVDLEGSVMKLVSSTSLPAPVRKELYALDMLETSSVHAEVFRDSSTNSTMRGELLTAN